MEIKATCQMCGKTYIKKNGKSMFCSDACRKARVKQRYEAEKDKRLAYQREWRKEHSDEAKERFKERHPNYSRDRARRNRGSQEYTKICIECGKTFTTWNPNKGTCSDECKAAHRKARDSHRVRAPRSPEENHRRYIIRTYGSEEAHTAYLEELEQEKQDQMEKTKARREREREERLAANFREGKCVVCGKAFTTYNPQQKTCCKECGRKLAYAKKQHRIPKNQIVDKDITLEALYRRDSGVCYLCGGMCDWYDRTFICVGEKYPSIDHIVPVSRGGLHAWNNVRLAHFGCNSKKSNELIPEAEKMVPLNAYSVKREPKEIRKKTIQLSKDGTVIAEYESTAEAERMTGIKQHGIQDCARGEKKTYCGFVWRYA